MRIYYLNQEYEPGKHKIVKVWSEFVEIAMPEDTPRRGISAPHSVLELDECYNRGLAKLLLRHRRDSPTDEILPDKYYVDGSGDLRDEFDNPVTINPNPQRESYKLSVFMGMTPTQIDTYIENNVSNLESAKELFKKIVRLLQVLARQSRLEE